jgi:hypothetical protein
MPGLLPRSGARYKIKLPTRPTTLRPSLPGARPGEVFYYRSFLASYILLHCKRDSKPLSDLFPIEAVSNAAMVGDPPCI